MVLCASLNKLIFFTSLFYKIMDYYDFTHAVKWMNKNYPQCKTIDEMVMEEFLFPSYVRTWIRTTWNKSTDSFGVLYRKKLTIDYLVVE